MTAAVVDSIRLVCPCGRKARISARFAGRRVRCAGCQGELRVPGSRTGSRSGSGSGSGYGRTERPSSRRARKPSGRKQAQRPASRRADPYAPPKAEVADRSGSGSRRQPKAATPRPSERTRRLKRDQSAEEHIQALGNWHQLSGAFGVMGAVVLLLMGSGGSAGAASGHLLLMGVIAFGIAVGSYVLGSSLKEFRPWARIVAGILSGLALVGALLGLAIEPSGLGMARAAASLIFNAACLWAYFGPGGQTVFSPNHRRGVEPADGSVSPFSYLPWVWILVTGAISYTMGASIAVGM